jgi:vanillate O-demethylase monooxygenase subunit
MAGWAEEVKQGQILTRRLLDQQVAIFRDNSGIPRALLDRCPHRFVPLSKGKLCDGGRSIECAYHGLQFDGSGACIHNPHGDGRIPIAAKVNSFPLVERHQCLWIWMGDAGKSDPSLIPDFSCMDEDQWHVGKGYLHAMANYELETDNIMDLSHIEFLHPGTLGGEAVKQAATQLKQEGNTIWSLRQTKNETMTDFLYESMGIPKGTKVDRWIDVRWDAPACMLLDSGATPTGRPRAEGTGSWLPHIFTPETGRTTHYWYAISFPKAMGPVGAEIANKVVAGLTVPFRNEDLPILEAQQKLMGDADFWEMKPVLLAGDGPAVRARRVLNQLIEQEKSPNASV